MNSSFVEFVNKKKEKQEEKEKKEKKEKETKQNENELNLNEDGIKIYGNKEFLKNDGLLKNVLSKLKEKSFGEVYIPPIKETEKPDSDSDSDSEETVKYIQKQPKSKNIPIKESTEVYQVKRFDKTTTREELYEFFSGIVGKDKLIKIRMSKNEERVFEGIIQIEIVATPDVKLKLLQKKLVYNKNRLKIAKVN